MMWTTQQRYNVGDLKAIRSGNGPPLLFIHGVGLRAEAWAGQISEFEEAYSVWAIDMPGHGESNECEQPYKLAGYTDAIAAAIVEPMIVIGHSMGGAIALDLAIRYPQKIKGVAALNTVFRRSKAASVAVKERAENLQNSHHIDPTETLLRWFEDTQSDEATACERWLSEMNIENYKKAYSVFANQDGSADKALRELHCPALFLTGEDEPNATPEMAHMMAKLAPDGNSAILLNARHMMPMTHIKSVNHHLGTFFQECLK